MCKINIREKFRLSLPNMKREYLDEMNTEKSNVEDSLSKKLIKWNNHRNDNNIALIPKQNIFLRASFHKPLDELTPNIYSSERKNNNYLVSESSENNDMDEINHIAARTYPITQRVKILAEPMNKFENIALKRFDSDLEKIKKNEINIDFTMEREETKDNRTKSKHPKSPKIQPIEDNMFFSFHTTSFPETVISFKSKRNKSFSRNEEIYEDEDGMRDLRHSINYQETLRYSCILEPSDSYVDIFSAEEGFHVEKDGWVTLSSEKDMHKNIYQKLLNSHKNNSAHTI